MYSPKGTLTCSISLAETLFVVNEALTRKWCVGEMVTAQAFLFFCWMGVGLRWINAKARKSKETFPKMLLLMEEIPNNHLGCIPKPANNGISTTYLSLNWFSGRISTINSMEHYSWLLPLWLFCLLNFPQPLGNKPQKGWLGLKIEQAMRRMILDPWSSKKYPRWIIGLLPVLVLGGRVGIC